MVRKWVDIKNKYVFICGQMDKSGLRLGLTHNCRIINNRPKILRWLSLTSLEIFVSKLRNCEQTDRDRQQIFNNLNLYQDCKQQ